jgi:hypothetical protein
MRVNVFENLKIDVRTKIQRILQKCAVEMCVGLSGTRWRCVLDYPAQDVNQWRCVLDYPAQDGNQYQPLVNKIMNILFSYRRSIGRSLAGTVGSNPTGGMEVCLL